MAPYRGWFPTKKPRGIRAGRGYRYSELEHIAHIVRVQGLELSPTDRAPGVEVLDRIEGMLLRPDIKLTYGIAHLPDGVEARSLFNESSSEVLIELDEVHTYVPLERDDDPRARWTLFHELGHAVLHLDKLIELSQLPHDHPSLQRGVRTHSFFVDTEWQADSFTAALLMPAAGMAVIEASGTVLTPEVLMSRYGCSWEASRYRLDNWSKRKEELLEAIKRS